jgi:hypothetical protein
MNDRKIDQVLDAFLELGPSAAPDRVGAAARHEIRGTRQTVLPVWWPSWRVPVMRSNTVRYGLAASVVVITALLGIRFLPGSSGSPAVSAEPALSSTPRLLPIGRELDPGTYIVRAADLTPRPFTITVPPGWRHENGFFSRGSMLVPDGVYFAPWTVTHFYENSCQRERGPYEVPSWSALRRALLQEAGPAAVADDPNTYSFAGRPAHKLTVSVAADVDLEACDEGILRFWPDPGPDESGGWIMEAGEQADVYIVAPGSDEQWVVFVAGREAGADPRLVAELEAMVASIRFE